MPPESSYFALAGEIDRIVSSPYPIQLKTLHELLSSKCTRSDLHIWALSNPCLITPLVARVLEALTQWPYVLEIVVHLSPIEQFRDAFLTLEPTLLPSILSSASTNPAHEQATLSLLSHPLPPALSLPGETQHLLARTLDAATAEPCTRTIESVYRLLRSTGPTILSAMTDERLGRLENAVVDLLQKTSVMADQTLSLLCLSIMGIVVETTVIGREANDKSWQAQKMDVFIRGRKAGNSLQLVTLLVLWALKGAEQDIGKRVEVLRLSEEIVGKFEKGVKETWVEKNETIVQKLCDKIRAEGDETLKVMALRFLGKLCEIARLPEPVRTEVEECFLKAERLVIATEMYSTDASLMKVVMASRGQDLIENAIQLTLNMGEDNSNVPKLNSMKYSLHLLRTFIRDIDSACSNIGALLTKASMAENLRQMLDLINRFPSDQTSSDRHNGVCTTTLQRSIMSVIEELSTIFLEIGLTHQDNDSCERIGHGTASILLNLHAAALRVKEGCPCHQQVPKHRAFSLAINEPVLMLKKEPGNWRNTMKQRMLDRAQTEYDEIHQVFAQACASLEARCENVEQPLRESQNECRELRGHIDQLRHTLKDSQQEMDNLRAECEGLLEESERTSKQHAEDIQHLQRQIRDAKDTSRARVAEIQDKMQISKIDAASSFAKQQSELEDALESLSATKKELVIFTSDLNKSREELSRKEAEAEQYKNERDELHDTLREAQATHSALETGIAELQFNNSRLLNDIATANEKLKLELERHHEEIKAKEAELQGFLEVEDTRHGNEIDKLVEQHREAMEYLKIQSDQELHEAQVQLNEEVEKRSVKIADLEHNITRLQRKCNHKDEQIAEAQSMRTNLMAAMGLQIPSPHADLPHRSRPSTAFTSQTKVPQTQKDISSQPTFFESPAQAQNPTTVSSFVSNASSTESTGGPTPKRPRPRTLIVASSPAKARTTKTNPQRRQTICRQPLSSVTGNVPRRQTSKPAFKVPSPTFDDDESFGGSGLFTDTQMMLPLDTDRLGK